MGRAITVEDVTPEWLTAVLRREGALPAGSVVAIGQEANAAFNSHTRHLQLVYSAEAPASAPARLLLKCTLPAAWAQRAGGREVAFYQAVQNLPDHPAVIVRCYDAVHDSGSDTDSGNSHILLDDLSESHIVPSKLGHQFDYLDNLPSDAHLAQAIDALARFHAYWWEHPQLGTGIAPIAWGCGSEEDYATEIARRGRALDHLLTQEGEEFPPDLRKLYRNNQAQMMYLWQTHMRDRVTTLSNMTLTHGDAYLANFLCPREGQSGDTYIIDWQCPEAYRGPTDLVNLCATFWTREQRADGERELNVLRHYHRTLQENGISGYSWEDLVTDYRLSIIDWLWIPVQDCYDGSGKRYWWPKMLCLAHAFEDWHCKDLFAPDLLVQTA